MPKISKNIKKLRAEKKLTQDALAEKIHVTRQAISNWENDKTKPDIEALESLAQAFEVDIEELIYGEKKEIINSQDKTKEKNRIKIILAIVGSLFVASGLALVFFGFWQEFTLPLQTVFSLVPMLLGQAVAIFTFIKKKESISWRESAAIIWTVGIVATIALIDNIYDISWIYTDYLVVDAILIIPVMFIMGAVAPLIFFYYMAIHIATVGSLLNVIISMLLFGAGVVFTYFISQNKEDSRGKYAQWITVLASIPIVIIYVFAGFEGDLLTEALSVIFAFMLAYFLCVFIATSEKMPFSLPYKPVSIIGLCFSMLALSVSGIYDTPEIENKIVPFVVSVVACILPPVVVGVFRKKSFADDKIRVITSALPFAMIVWIYIYAVAEEILMDSVRQGMIEHTVADTIMLVAYFLGAVLTISFGGILVYQGIKKLRLFVINFGVITVFVQIMSIYSNIGHMNIFVLGALLAVFGVGIIVLNCKMLSMKKSLKEQSNGGDNDA